VRTRTRLRLLRCAVILMPLGLVIPGVAAIIGKPVGSMWLTNYSCPLAFLLADAIILASSREWTLRVFAFLSIASLAGAILCVNLPGINYNMMNGPGYFYSVLFAFVLLPLSAVLSLVVFVLALREARRDPAPEGHCTFCGDSLRGSGDTRCPECGAPFGSSLMGGPDAGEKIGRNRIRNPSLPTGQGAGDQ